jgi:hypothetical protein
LTPSTLPPTPSPTFAAWFILLPPTAGRDIAIYSLPIFQRLPAHAHAALHSLRAYLFMPLRTSLRVRFCLPSAILVAVLAALDAGRPGDRC